VKGRSEVSGGGKKPWRQKGTGRARAGSIRSPIWRGGGTMHGPQPRSYAYRLPRSGRRAALSSALAQKARDGQVRVIDSLVFDSPKTKQLRQLLGALGIEQSVLIVTAETHANLRLSARNLPHVHTLPVAGLNVYDILKHDILLVAQDALAAIEERLA
jgi:large subunit ribosomal protein L4